MKEQLFIQYEKMLGEIEACRAEKQDSMKEIESCFHLAQHYWGQVEQVIEEYVFSSSKEEIEYYKEVKPLFKSHIEYYNLLYHAELFRPSGDTADITEFWIKEQQRLHRFILDNSDFYDYYKTKSSDRDELYFLSSGLTVYYDDLIAVLLALERYTAHIQNHLKC